MLRSVCLVVCGTVVALQVAVVGAEQGQLFEKLDRDKSGAISRQEFVSCPLVRDRDGRVQHQDLCANPGSALSVQEKNRLYDKIDSERKGAITRKRLNRFATPDGFAPIRF